MKFPIARLIGSTFVILGCSALAFGCLQAWLVWGGDQGSWPMQMATLRGNLEFGAEISALIGVGAIALGFWLRRLKGAAKAGH